MNLINRIPDRYDIQSDRPEGAKEDAALRFVTTEEGVTVYLTATTDKPRTITLRWKNPISRPVKVLGDAWERGYGTFSWNSLCAEKWMPWYFLLCEEHAEGAPTTVTGYGVMVQPSAMASWECDTEGITLCLDVRCGGVGVELNGRELEVCTVVSRLYENTHSYPAAKAFCKVMSPNPLLPEKPVYGGNNWYYAYGDSSYEEIVSDCSLQAKLAEGLSNRPFMVIDDGWQPNSCAGPWIANEKYGDMKKVADTFKAMDVRPGIWVRFLRDERPEIPAEWRLNKRNLAHDDPRFLREGFLDPSHPEVAKFIADDVKKIVNQWGYELIKHDFSMVDMFGAWGKDRNRLITNDGWSFYDKTKTSAEIVKDFYKNILDATDGKCLILGCNCIGHLLAGLAHLNRTGDDTSGYEWGRTRQMGVNTLAFRMCQHNAFFAADADCVGFLPDCIDWRLNRQWATLAACSATPLFISSAADTLTDEQVEVMKELYARASKAEDELIPLDWEYTTAPRRYLLNGEVVEFNWFDVE